MSFTHRDYFPAFAFPRRTGRRRRSPRRYRNYLQVLAQEDLVMSRRDGYYVVYAANLDRITAVAPNLHAFIAPERSADVTYAGWRDPP